MLTPSPRLGAWIERQFPLRVQLLLAFWLVATLPILAVLAVENTSLGYVHDRMRHIFPISYDRPAQAGTAQSTGDRRMQMQFNPGARATEFMAVQPNETPQQRVERVKRAIEMRQHAETVFSVLRTFMILISVLVLLGAVLLGSLVSYWMARRIARPVETEQARSQAELTRVGKELEIAARIQSALLPVHLGAESYDMAIAQVAAAEVGGDLLDYRPQPDGTFWLAVGDATGHGLSPGLISMMTQSLFAGVIEADPGVSPSRALARVNRALYENVKYRLKDDNHLTLQLLRHEGDGRFVAAGLHVDLLVYRAETGRVERIEVPGIWVGLLPDVSEHTVDVPFSLAPDDVLLVYTDGLTEARDAAGTQFDMERLEAALARHAGLDADSIRQRVMAEVCAWQHDQADDLSLLVLKRRPVGARTLVA